MEGAAVAPFFSARESEIVALIALGFEDKQIAAMLGISRRTLSRKLKTYGAAELLEISVA